MSIKATQDIYELWEEHGTLPIEEAKSLSQYQQDRKDTVVINDYGVQNENRSDKKLGMQNRSILTLKV